MIKIFKKPRLKNPNMIAAWPGMGNVALRATVFLKDKLQAKEFAQLDPAEFFYPADILIEQALVKIPELPKGKFYWWEDKISKESIIIFISDAQVTPEKSYDYANKIIDVALDFNVKRIFTFAAMPVPIDHFHKPEVWGAATHKRLIEELKRHRIKPMTRGQISGLNGLFLGVAKERGLSGTCLLGETPLYTIQIENPKASLAVLEKLTFLLNIKVDLDELNLAGRIMEEEIEKLIDYIKTSPEERAKPISEEEIEKIKKMLSAQSRIPDSAKKRIEQLFSQSQKEISKTSELKKELDNWNVYKEYEDRFLDLFKKKEKKDN